jgi:hypothetical protein
VSETPRDFDRDRIADVAIDRAVREIMSADPGPAFRQRVLARIVAEPAGGRRPWLPQLAVAAATIAIALAAVLWMRTPAPAPVSTTVATTPALAPHPASPPAPAPSPTPSASQSDAPASTPAVTRRPSPAGRRVAGVDASEPRIVEAASIETAIVDDAAGQGSVPTTAPPPAAAALPDAVRLAEIALPPIVIKEIVLEPLLFGGR